MKLNDKTVKGMKPKDAKYFVHGDMSNDKHGFAICVYPASIKYPAGTKSWFFIYRFEGKRCFLPLGKYPTMGLAEAAQEFDRHWQVFISGKNPATVAEDKQAELEAAPTVKMLGADYIERYAKVNKKSWLEDKRILEKEIYPTWGKRKAQDIVKRDVISLLNKVVDRGAPQTANNIFKILRKLFNWSIKQDILQISPCDRVDMPAPTNTKDRALDTNEIKTVWAAIDGTTPLSMTIEVRQALKLILITAQRPAEVSGLHTREIDGEWWTIPSERSKNGKAHRVYLSAMAREIVSEAIAQARLMREVTLDREYSGYIFPCPHRAKDKPIDRHSLSKALKRNTADDGLTVLGVATFTPHDLRRTATTLMAGCKIGLEHRERVLNHTQEKLDGIYNQHDYDDEKQVALETLARKLASITTASKVGEVIPITRKTA